MRKAIMSWVLANPNKIGVILFALFSWVKAYLAARFDYQVLPATDHLVLTLLTAFGLYSTTRPTPPKP